MTDTGRSRTTAPPKVTMERGAELHRQGAVRSAVFHVQGEDVNHIVYERRQADGTVDLACTCALGQGCEHVAAVLVHIGTLVSGVEAPEAVEHAERTSWTTDDGLIGSPVVWEVGAGVRRDVAALYYDADRTRRLRDTLESIIVTLLGRGLEEGHVALVEQVTAMEELLDGIEAMDVARPCAQLRDMILGTRAEPGRMAMVLERMHGVLGVLDDALDGRGPGPDIESSYLGRSWTFDESGREEDVTLLEMARSTALTPFGLRRNRVFHLDLDSGRVFVEHSHEGAAEQAGPSVGPFPRRLQAGLMMVMPGIPPSPVRLLQYVILPPPTEADLIRLKKFAMIAVDDTYARLRDVVAVARAPYPAFVMFAPSRTVVILVDGEGAALALAHRIDPPACAALARIAESSHVHCVAGLLVWTGHEIALNPLSVLHEHSQGLGLLRLR
jgi:hypothetical protein